MTNRCETNKTDQIVIQNKLVSLGKRSCPGHVRSQEIRPEQYVAARFISVTQIRPLFVVNIRQVGE